jgi:hypothetical protein
VQIGHAGHERFDTLIAGLRPRIDLDPGYAASLDFNPHILPPAIRHQS